MSIFLAEIDYYDLSGATTGTLYYGTHAFVTGPSDSPANTYFDERIKQPALLSRHMFGRGRVGGASREDQGQIVLYNNDGELDSLLDYAFDGRDITVWWGEEGDTFPTDFEEVMVATMAGPPEFARNEVRIQLRDRQELVDVPIQTTLYAGDNALPAGLEGVEDIKGKQKPVCLGKVTNVPAVLVNSAKLIYQVNDGAVDSVDQVYDSGIRLANSIWTPQEATNNLSSAFAESVAWGEDTFVAGCGNGNIYYSTDGGDTWTLADSTIFGTGSNTVHAVHYANGKFVAVGFAGKIATSADGQSWTERTSGTVTTLRDVTWGEGTWLVAGNATVLTSTDAETWSEETGHGATGVRCCAFGVGVFVMSGVTDDEIYYSEDVGSSWTTVSDTAFGSGWDIDYGGGLFVLYAQATGGGSAYFMASADGTTWETVHESALSQQGSAIEWAEQIGWVALSADSVFWSPDGYDWIRRDVLTQFSSYTTSDAAFSDTGYVFVGLKALWPTPPGTYSSQADLLDDDLQPDPGTYKYYAAGGYFRLGSAPAGQVTADVTQGASASDRTAGQLFTDLLERAGLSSSDWVAADITILDSSKSYELGLWIGLEEMSVKEALDDVARSALAWWGVDRKGRFRIAEFGGLSVGSLDNLVANPGFEQETSSLPGWSEAGTGSGVWSANTTVVRSGGVAAEHDPAGQTGEARLQNSEQAAGTNTDGRAAAEGDQFYCTAWVRKVSTGTPNRARVKITFRDESGSFLGATNGTLITPTTTYQQVEVTSTAPAGTAQVFFELSVVNDGNSEPILFDDVYARRMVMTTPVADQTITDNDIVGWPEKIRAKDSSKGVPIYRSVVRYAKNYTVQESGLVAGVSDARRGILSKEWREETDEDTSIQTTHPLAKEEATETLIHDSGDASSEATARLGLFGEQRDLLEIVVPVDAETIQRDLGSIVKLESSRLGLSAGDEFVIVGVEPDGARKQFRWEVWR